MGFSVLETCELHGGIRFHARLSEIGRGQGVSCTRRVWISRSLRRRMVVSVGGMDCGEAGW